MAVRTGTVAVPAMHYTPEEDFLDRMDHWLHHLPPHLPDELVPDLFYLEMRLGCWACPHLYGTAPFRVSITPFSDRKFIEACFALPIAWREEHRSHERMIGMADPRLLDTPFETLTGWANLRYRLGLG